MCGLEPIVHKGLVQQERVADQRLVLVIDLQEAAYGRRSGRWAGEVGNVLLGVVVGVVGSARPGLATGIGDIGIGVLGIPVVVAVGALRIRWIGGIRRVGEVAEPVLGALVGHDASTRPEG